MFTRLKRLVLGNPIATQQEHAERLSIPIALAVFASDALSSTAYATEEILLALVGTTFATASNLISLPVALGIVLLMAIVVLSYRQVIRAYPCGGGTYSVSKEFLGPFASETAGAALLIDYVLTVAVSVSAGVAALTSTGLVPHKYNVSLAIVFIGIITLANLRGVKESGRWFAVPAYIFILTMFTLLGWGAYLLITGSVEWPTFSLVTALSSSKTAQTAVADWTSIPILLAMMYAFSHGCAALTGIEAVSNGVKAFKEPADVNANKTLVLMGFILGTIFVGCTILAFVFGIQPDHHETVISQIGRFVFGGSNPLYFILQGITMLILVLAANTSFAGFPRLASILAQDGYLPRQLMTMGDRLVFSNGIIALGIVSAVMVWLYGADTHALIPLYAVGVFLSFTLSQSGMVVKQLAEKADNWRWGVAVNGLGALTTGLVTILLTVEKFTAGAWIVAIAIPLLIMLFRSTKHHYKTIFSQLSLPKDGYCPGPIHDHTVLVLVSTLHRGTIPALEYAKTISDKVEAVHIELKPEATKWLQEAWKEWGCGIQLTILQSPYRSLIQPVVDYVDEVENRTPDKRVTVIIPEFVTKQFWHNFLHNQTALLIKTILRSKPGVIVTTVRYHLEK